MGSTVRAGLPMPLWAAVAVSLFFAAALALYGGSLRNPLIFDDEQLTDEFIRRYSAFFAFDLRWMSYATFGAVRGLAGADWWWQRLANVLVHAAVAAVLLGFLFRLQCIVLREARHAGAAQIHAAWLAFFGALFFLLHPAAVYGVAYLIQRSILLATFWSLVCLWLFLEGLVARSTRLHAAAAIAYVFALYSKEHVVMVPAVAAALAVLARQPRGGDWRALARELALPFALFGAAGMVVVLQLKGVLGMPYERFAEDAARQVSVATAGASAEESLFLRSAINQGSLYFRYLASWLVPWPGAMAIDLRPPFPVAVWSPYLAGFTAWLAWPVLCGWLILKGGRAGLAGFALLSPWLLGLTEMAVVRLQEMFVLYRSYLWMALLPAALPALTGMLRPTLAFGTLGIAALLLVPASLDRLATFSSPLKAWHDAVEKLQPARPYADRTWRNRGWAHYQAEQFEQALADFNQAIALDPGNPKSWFQRATLHLRLGRAGLAAADFDRVLALAPNDVAALGRRCLAYMRLQQLALARADCVRAAQGNAADPDNFVSLGMVHALEGNAERAEHNYAKALALAPRSGMAHYQYGVLLRGLGRAAEARREFALACQAGMANACSAPAGR